MNAMICSLVSHQFQADIWHGLHCSLGLMFVRSIQGFDESLRGNQQESDYFLRAEG